VRVLASLAIVGIQQAVPAPLPVSIVVCVLAALGGAWAVATLRG
jgi:hypothetical protein